MESIFHTATSNTAHRIIEPRDLGDRRHGRDVRARKHSAAAAELARPGARWGHFHAKKQQGKKHTKTSNIPPRFMIATGVVDHGNGFAGFKRQIRVRGCRVVVNSPIDSRDLRHGGVFYI